MVACSICGADAELEHRDLDVILGSVAVATMEVRIVKCRNCGEYALLLLAYNGRAIMIGGNTDGET